MSEGRARSVVVVSGGLGQPSSTRLLADRITAATERHLRDAGFEPAAEIVELRDHAHDLTNHLLTGFPSPTLQAATDAVLAADGLIAVTSSGALLGFELPAVRLVRERIDTEEVTCLGRGEGAAATHVARVGRRAALGRQRPGGLGVLAIRRC